MKKGFLYMSLFMYYVYGSPGCMDNSFHLTKMFDYKNYHYVSCNCPCEKQYKILANRGQCSKCLHYRDPQYTTFAQSRESHIPLCLSKQPQATIFLIDYPKNMLHGI